jgi:hypothetical protein
MDLAGNTYLVAANTFVRDHLAQPGRHAARSAVKRRPMPSSCRTARTAGTFAWRPARSGRDRRQTCEGVAVRSGGQCTSSPATTHDNASFGPAPRRRRLGRPIIVRKYDTQRERALVEADGRHVDVPRTRAVATVRGGEHYIGRDGG